MNFKHTLAFMFIISFIFQYFVMSLISTNNYTDIRNSIGKMYLSIIMAIFMVIFEVFMHDMSYHTIHSHYYVILASLFVIFIVLVALVTVIVLVIKTLFNRHCHEDAPF